MFNGLVVLLFSLFYVIREFDGLLHRGWAQFQQTDFILKLLKFYIRRDINEEILTFDAFSKKLGKKFNCSL